MNELVGVIGYKLIMGVVIGLVITGIILLVKYATHKKASSPYIFEQFADSKNDLVEKLRNAIAQFQKDLLIIRVCARETCNITKSLEDLFAKNMATLDKDMTDLPADLKTKWEKYRAAGAQKAFKLYMNDYSWTHNRVQLLECFAGDELQELVKQVHIAAQSKEFKEAIGLFIITKNTLKFNELFLSEMKKGSNAIKNVVSSLVTAEGFANQLEAGANAQLKTLDQFRKAVEKLQKEVDEQKETLIDIVKTFSEVTPAPPSISSGLGL